MVLKNDLQAESISLNAKPEHLPEVAIVKPKAKFTLYLFLCVLTVSTGAFQFGYNISSLNPLTLTIKAFIRDNTPLFRAYTKQLASNSTLNGTEVDLKSVQKSVDEWLEVFWAVLNSLFVVGGMLGALTSKPVINRLGRKGCLFYVNIFGVAGGVLALVSFYAQSTACLLVSRLLFGYQCGMLTCVSPIYLSEIAPLSLRGQVGTFPQISFTIGVLFAQVLAFREILGTKKLWHFVIAGPIVPALLACIFLLLIPETPVELLKKDEEKARRALERLRNSRNVSEELAQMRLMASTQANGRQVTLRELLKMKELRWPLTITVLLILSQQFSGVNAVFFYSAEIFISANIPPSMLQYAILSTGVVIFFTSIMCMFLVDKLGRRNLLIMPIIVIIIDFIVLTTLLSLKERYPILSYLCIVCVLVYLTCFSIGLGPIPAIYAAECFPPDVRSTTMSVIGLLNWLNSLVWTLGFPLLIKLIGQYVFLIFSGVMIVVLYVLFKKMVETKGKTTNEIIALYGKQ